MITALHHVQLAMPEGQEDKARAFFTALGFHEVPKPAPLAGRGGVWFEAGSARLHLGVEADFRPAQKAHPAFELRDLEAFLARCAAAGIAATPDPDLPGFTRAFVSDPFGNRLEFLQPLEAPQ